MKKATASILKAVALLGLLAALVVPGGTSAAQPYTGTFDDVPPTHPFFTEIEWAVARGITLGCDSANFCPAAPVTRQGMAAFVYRYLGSPAFTPPAKGKNTFSDVLWGQPFYKEIEWMVAQGYATGYGDGTFKPKKSIVRQHLAAFLYRLAGSPAFTPPLIASFTDVPKTHFFFKEIEWLASTAITGGFTDGTFRPTIDVSRGSMAAFLYRYDDLFGGSGPGMSRSLSGDATGGGDDAAAISDAATGSGDGSAAQVNSGNGPGLPVAGSRSDDLARLGGAVLLGGVLLVVATQRRKVSTTE